MKFAISIPDADFQAGEAMARRMNRPRSALYALALREFLARQTTDDLTEAANRLADSLDERDLAEIALITRAGARTVLANTDW